MGISKRATRIFIFVGLSIASIAIVLLLTVDQRTWEALSKVNPLFLLPFAGLWWISLSLDAFSLMLYTRGTDEKLKYIPAMRTSTLRIFFNVVTPFTFGGQPLSIVSLRHEGIPTGKASSIVITKLMTLIALAVIIGITAFLVFHNKISNIAVLNNVFFVSGFLGVFFVALIILGFLYPHFLVKLITRAGKLLHALRLVKDTQQLKRDVVKTVCLARRSFKKYFSHHLGYFIGGTACNGAGYFIQLFLLYLIFYGLGIEMPIVNGIILSAILLFLMTFMPTPGAAGFGEGMFVLLFAATVPKYLLGIAIVLWRFFYQYLSAIIGAISSSKYVSDMISNRDKNKEISKQDDT
jgi:glycosyltransferase 2 family protein